MKQLAWLTLLGVMAGACGGLNARLLGSSVQKPSNVAIYFALERSDGKPVAGLKADRFKIYEDEQLISPFESKQTILNPEVAVVHHVLLLLDLSGSITESGSLEELVGAAQAFSERMTKSQKVAVYGFDGGTKLIPLVSSTKRAAAVSRGLARLKHHKTKDPSTNLNGAVLEAVKVLDKQMASSRQPLRFGTLVVFTDGTDRAHRVSADEMQQKLEESTLNVFTIGLGAEISSAALSQIGKTGFIRAKDASQMGQAFASVAESIENSARKFYLLSYCSPSRAGKHKLKVSVSVGGASGSLEQEFDATGFGPRCNPKRPPRFNTKRLLLRKKR